MKLLRDLMLLAGLLVLALAFGFIFQNPLAIGFWPWPDGRLSYLFVGSIFAASAASMLWIGWTGEWGALPGGTLNVAVIGLGTFVYFLLLYLQGNHTDLLIYAFAALLVGLASAGTFFWSRRFPLRDARSMPGLAHVSFWIFAAALLLSAAALILRQPIFPWSLNPDSSVIFGCIFLGNAAYFIYGLTRRLWHNALGQLLSFLAYDLVLIGPFLALFRTVKPEYVPSLIAYIVVLSYSGALAVYYLFIDSKTRFGS